MTTIPHEQTGSNYTICLHCGHIESPAATEITSENLGGLNCIQCGLAEQELRQVGTGTRLARACAGCESIIPPARIASGNDPKMIIRFCVKCQTLNDNGERCPKDPLPPDCPECHIPMVIRDQHVGPVDPFLGLPKLPQMPPHHWAFKEALASQELTARSYFGRKILTLFLPQPKVKRPSGSSDVEPGLPDRPTRGWSGSTPPSYPAIHWRLLSSWQRIKSMRQARLVAGAPWC